MTNLPAIFEGLPKIDDLWDRIKFSEKGLLLAPDTTLDEYRRILGYVVTVREMVADVCAWALADLLLQGEVRWGETYTQAIDETKMDYHYLANLRSAAKAFPPERRRNLSIGHHEAVRTLPVEYQDELLDLAEKNKWSRDELREVVREAKGEQPVMVRVLASWKEDVLELLHQMVQAAVSGRVDDLLELAQRGKELIT